MSEATRRRIRLEQGDLYGILGQLLRNSHNSKLIFQQKDCFKMLSYKMKKRWMNEINEKLEKFKMGSSTKSIRTDMSKGNMIFSEESSRVIYEMGNLYWTDGRTTKYTERVSVGTRLGLTSGSSTSTTSPRLTSVTMHLTDSDNDM